jgi:hypothetical protein
MNIVLAIVGVAALLLTLRTIGVWNLPEDELAKLEAIRCPICRRNVQTIMAVCSLIRGFQRLMGRSAERLRQALTRRAKKITKSIGPAPNKSATSHS